MVQVVVLLLGLLVAALPATAGANRRDCREVVAFCHQTRWDTFRLVTVPKCSLRAWWHQQHIQQGQDVLLADVGAQYPDADGDSFGDPSGLVEDSCPLEGYVPTGGDCDDSDAGINPNAVEIPGNGLDDDCDDATPDTLPCAGVEFGGHCWITGETGESCNSACSDHGGFNAAASQHSGNPIGRLVSPGLATIGNWKSVECSDMDAGINWGATGGAPDGNFIHGSCRLHCVCNE
jgi:hypothetical protein